MRRVLSSVTVVLGVAAVISAPGVPATAAPEESAKKVCTITDSRLVELSGLVALKSGYVVINDSSDHADRNKIFYLDAKCKVKQARSYSGRGPLDTEDLSLSRDGKTLYIADIGDNDLARPTVGLWTMPVDGSKAPVINRLTYPDGKHDAEALLINGDGTPIIVTRGDAAGKAAFYSPTGPLQPGSAQGVPMTKRGEITLPRTTTDNWAGGIGRLLVTGGATAPDGSRVVLRTYADAFEWDVPDGDVVAAVTKGTPRATPLPKEPRGEAIAYSPDGATFLTVSETADQPEGTRPEILRYTRSQVAAPEISDPNGNQPGGQSWFEKLSLQDITYLIGSVGVLGVVLVGVGVFGIVRARRKPPEDRPGPDSGRPPGPDGGGRAVAYNGHDRGGSGWDRPPGSADGYPNGPGDRDRRQRPGGAVYGGGRPSGGAVYGGGGGAPSGGVYGGGPSRGSSGAAGYGGAAPPGAGGRPDRPSSGGVYGGGPSRGSSGGAVYGGGPAGPGDGKHSGPGGYAENGRSGNGNRGRSGRYGPSRAERPDFPDDRRGYR